MVILSPSKIIIGIDPASAGAITVLTASHNSEAVAVMVFSWKKVTRAKKRVFMVDTWLAEKPKRKTQKISRHAASMAKFIACKISDFIVENELLEVDLYLGTEDAYIGRSAKTGIAVAKFAGQMAGVLEATLDIQSEWIRAAGWRKEVLNLSHFTKRAPAKRASLHEIPKKIQGLRQSLIILGDLDHITDAAGVALWVLSTKDK